MKKLNSLGIGPKMAVIFLPWLTTSIILSTIKNDFFVFTSGNKIPLRVAGIIIMLIGLIFYFSTVRLLLKGLKETRLITT